MIRVISSCVKYNLIMLIIIFITIKIMISTGSVKSFIYDSLLGKNNPNSPYYAYNQILNQISEESTILDIGCGTGIYFDNQDVVNCIIDKKLKIHCVDIDQDAVAICKERVKKNGIYLNVTCDTCNLLNIDSAYDYILFIESFPVIDLELFNKMLNHTKKITKNVILFHNLVREKTIFLDYIKPNIKYLTSIDMGRLTSLDDMIYYLDEQMCHNYSIIKSSQCKYKDLHPVLNIPFIHNKVSIQYTTTITHT